jgi:hypothetical protein
MLPNLRFATAAAVIVAVAAAGFGAAVLTRHGAVGGPTAAGSGPLPTRFQAIWRPVGPRPHPTPSGGVIALGLEIAIDETTITIPELHGAVANSWSLIEGDRLDVRILDIPVVARPVDGGTVPTKIWPCQVGDAGTYTFVLSADDRQLTLNPLDDACATRAAILAGEWVRTGIGDLAQGPNVAPLFRPFGGGTSGRFSFSVPAGWSETTEYETSLALAGDAANGTTIAVLSSVVPNPQGAPCAEPGVIPSTPTPRDLAQWLILSPDLRVATPVPVTIGGLAGVMVDVSVRDERTNHCDGSGFHTFGEAVQAEGQNVALTVAGEKWARYYLLDAGDGQTLLIDVEAPDWAKWKRALADTMPIIDTFEFGR